LESEFFIGGEVFGIDAFGSAITYCGLHAKIIAGYAADADGDIQRNPV
jgi:hypothetical protein